MTLIPGTGWSELIAEANPVAFARVQHRPTNDLVNLLGAVDIAQHDLGLRCVGATQRDVADVQHSLADALRVVDILDAKQLDILAVAAKQAAGDTNALGGDAIILAEREEWPALPQHLLVGRRDSIALSHRYRRVDVVEHLVHRLQDAVGDRANE